MSLPVTILVMESVLMRFLSCGACRIGWAHVQEESTPVALGLLAICHVGALPRRTTAFWLGFSLALIARFHQVLFLLLKQSVFL